MGICAGLKVLSLIIFLLDWFMIRWKYKLDMNHTMTVGDIVNSIISVDRGGLATGAVSGAAGTSGVICVSLTLFSIPCDVCMLVCGDRFALP